MDDKGILFIYLFSRTFKRADSCEPSAEDMTDHAPRPPLERVGSRDTLMHMLLPGGHTVVICVSDKMTTQEALEYACNKCMLVPNDHFIRLRLDANSFKVPDKCVALQGEVSNSFNVPDKCVALQGEVSNYLYYNSP